MSVYQHVFSVIWDFLINWYYIWNYFYSKYRGKIIPMKYTRFIYLFIILTEVCLFPAISHASAFMPIVTNYTAKDYQAGLQNWALAQGKNGEMYIGNNTGLLCFDGYTWSNHFV